MLDHGADPNLAGSGQLALNIAASTGDLETVKALLAHGADPNASPDGKESALAEACDRGHLEIAQLLFAHGAKLETPGQVGCTALFRAVGYSNSPPVARWLLSVGANPNAPNSVGATPLHHAVEYGCVDSVRILMAAGADPNLADKNGRTPLSLARAYPRSIIAKYQGSGRHPRQSATAIQRQLLAALQMPKLLTSH